MAEDQPVRVPIDAEIDLHAFAPADIPSLVEEYIEAAAAAGFREVRVVHGRGRGVQRGIVQATLDKHARVVEFWDDPASHLGATMVVLAEVRLKPDPTGTAIAGPYRHHRTPKT